MKFVHIMLNLMSEIQIKLNIYFITLYNSTKFYLLNFPPDDKVHNMLKENDGSDDKYQVEVMQPVFIRIL